MSYPLDLFLSLKSSSGIPLYLSGSTLAPASKALVLSTPYQSYSISSSSELFLRNQRLLKPSKKHGNILLFLDASFRLESDTYKQKPLSVCFLKIYAPSFTRIKRPIFLDYKDLKFPRKLRSFCFPRVGALNFFLPKRLHFLLRSRLIGLRGTVYLLNFLRIVPGFQGYLPLVLHFRLLNLFFTLPFFPRKLRFFTLKRLLPSFPSPAIRDNLVEKVLFRVYLLWGRFVSTKILPTSLSLFFFFILSKNNVKKRIAFYLQTSKFLKQPRRYRVPSLSPVLRSYH